MRVADTSIRTEVRYELPNLASTRGFRLIMAECTRPGSAAVISILSHFLALYLYLSPFLSISLPFSIPLYLPLSLSRSTFLYISLSLSLSALLPPYSSGVVLSTGARLLEFITLQLN